MSGIEAHASGEAVEFQIEDDNGEQSQFRLDRRLTTTLILLALQELARLPDLEGELLQEAERPLLQGRPSVQVGIGESGDVLLEFRLDPATMQFLIDDEMAIAMVQQVSEIMATPRSVRYQPNKN